MNLYTINSYKAYNNISHTSEVLKPEYNYFISIKSNKSLIVEL